MSTIYPLPVYESSKLRPVVGLNDTGGMIGKASQHSYPMPGLYPMPGKLRYAGGRRSHLRGKVLGYVKDPHGTLIVTELEDHLVEHRDCPLQIAASVIFPSLSIPLENLLAREPVKDSQLDDMEMMVERARKHLEPGA